MWATHWIKVANQYLRVSLSNTTPYIVKTNLIQTLPPFNNII